VLSVKAFASGEWQANCYVVHDEQGDGVVIDPGEEVDAVLGYAAERALRIRAILATHAHYDHIASVQDLKERFQVPFFLHGADARLLRQANFYRKIFGGKRTISIPTMDHDLAAGRTLQFGALSIDVMHTPGHTPGSVSFLTEGHLFVGDTVLAKRIGRTDLPGGDKSALAESVRRVFALPAATLLCPGHGPTMTLAESRTINREAAELVR